MKPIVLAPECLGLRPKLGGLPSFTGGTCAARPGGSATFKQPCAPFGFEGFFDERVVWVQARSSATGCFRLGTRKSPAKPRSLTCLGFCTQRGKRAHAGVRGEGAPRVQPWARRGQACPSLGLRRRASAAFSQPCETRKFELVTEAADGELISLVEKAYVGNVKEPLLCAGSIQTWMGNPARRTRTGVETSRDRAMHSNGYAHRQFDFSCENFCSQCRQMLTSSSIPHGM